MNRDAAWELLTTYTKRPNLQKHALAVEAAMRRYALEFGEDKERWGVVGLLHDFDYEAFPDEHPDRGTTMLEELGYPEDVIHAIRAHASFTGAPRESRLDKALYAVDELTGFIVAVALIRPSKSLAEVTVASVRKKLKSKAFCKPVNRNELQEGAEDLGIEMDEHIGHVLTAMQEIADELGLA